MSLRARLIVGMVVVAVVLAGAMVVITRTTQADLVDRVDAQLEGSAGPIRRFDRPGPGGGGGGGPDGGPGGAPAPAAPRNLSSLYVGSVDGDGAVTTLAAPSRGSRSARRRRFERAKSGPLAGRGGVRR